MKASYITISIIGLLTLICSEFKSKGLAIESEKLHLILEETFINKKKFNLERIELNKPSLSLSLLSVNKKNNCKVNKKGLNEGKENISVLKDNLKKKILISFDKKMKNLFLEKNVNLEDTIDWAINTVESGAPLKEPPSLLQIYTLFSVKMTMNNDFLKDYSNIVTEWFFNFKNSLNNHPGYAYMALQHGWVAAAQSTNNIIKGMTEDQYNLSNFTFSTRKSFEEESHKAARTTFYNQFLSYDSGFTCFPKNGETIESFVEAIYKDTDAYFKKQDNKNELLEEKNINISPVFLYSIVLKFKNLDYITNLTDVIVNVKVLAKNEIEALVLGLKKIKKENTNFFNKTILDTELITKNVFKREPIKDVISGKKLEDVSYYWNFKKGKEVNETFLNNLDKHIKSCDSASSMNKSLQALNGLER